MICKGSYSISTKVHTLQVIKAVGSIKSEICIGYGAYRESVANPGKSSSTTIGKKTRNRYFRKTNNCHYNARARVKFSLELE